MGDGRETPRNGELGGAGIAAGDGFARTELSMEWGTWVVGLGGAAVGDDKERAIMYGKDSFTAHHGDREGDQFFRSCQSMKMAGDQGSLGTKKEGSVVLVIE